MGPAARQLDYMLPSGACSTYQIRQIRHKHTARILQAGRAAHLVGFGILRTAEAPLLVFGWVACTGTWDGVLVDSVDLGSAGCNRKPSEHLVESYWTGTG
jgi:hypothetical protein